MDAPDRAPARLVIALGCFMASFVAVLIGLRFATVMGTVSPVWPASGLAVACGFRWGRRGLVAAVTGAMLANLVNGTPWGVQPFVSVGHLLEALVAEALLRRGGYRPALDRPRDVGVLLLAGVAGPALSAVCGVAGLLIGPGLGSVSGAAALALWWTGNAVGVVVMTPLVLAWTEPTPSPTAGPIERAGQAVALLAVCGLVFASELSAGAAVTAPLGFAAFPLLIWAALRLGPRAATASLVVALGFSLGAASAGGGPFVGLRLDQSYWLFETYAAVAAVSTLLVLTTTEALRASLAERRALELELVQKQKMEALGAFAGGIAHDFNNLLTVVSANTELARAHTDDPRALRAVLDDIQDAGRRGADLVAQLVTFSRPGAADRRPVQLSTLVAAATRVLLRPRTPAGVDLVVDTRAGPDEPAVLADPVQIDRIVQNLGTNALLAMRERGAGTLTVRVLVRAFDEAAARALGLEPGRYVGLSVADTGVGMAPEVLARVTEPFFTTRSRAEGSGLGIPVVHGIVQGCGGALEVTSAPGAGSTFTAWLPATDQRPAPAVAPTVRVERERPRRRVLLIDDDPGVLLAAQRALEQLGCEVDAFLDGDAALERLRAGPREVDLIVTDLTMPGLSGRAVAARAREARPGLPVVLITGHAAPEAADPVFAAVVPKPFDLARMRDALELALAPPPLASASTV